MNYIKLINGFWQIRRERPDFDPYVVALYFALLDIANRRDWKPFTAYREDIVALSGMSAKPYYKSRAILKEAGLIDFKEGASKKIMCSFTITEPLPVVTVQTTLATTVQTTVGDTVATTEGTTILNKPINLKTYKLLNDILKRKKSKFIKYTWKYPKCSAFENTEWIGNKEKPKEKKVAPKKEKVQEHYFEQSPYYERQKFLEYWTRDKYPISEFNNTDTIHYYEKLKYWAEYGSGKSPGKKTAKDWIGTARTFMRGDIEKGQLKLRYRSTPAPQPAQTGIKHLDPNAPDYYDKLKEHYGFSKAS